MPALTETQLIIAAMLLGFICLSALIVILYKTILNITKVINGNEDYGKTVGHASQRARLIVDDASKQAQAILVDSQTFKDAMQKRLMEVYEHALASSKAGAEEKMVVLQKEIEQLINSSHDNNIKMIQKIDEDIKNSSQLVSDKFIKDMQDRIIAMAAKRESLMQEELDKIDKDLQGYKKAQMERIDNNIYDILARASEAVLGKAVNLDLHQELIIKALEQAKREGVFI